MSCGIWAQEIPVLKYEELQQRIQGQKNKTVLVNFWATWCGPCIEEMPILMEMLEAHKDNSLFKMLLVSLDSKKNMDKLSAFLEKHKIEAEVVLLDDNKRMNKWIPFFDAGWQGNLPATIVYVSGEKVAFFDKAVSRDDLRNLAQMYLSPSK